MAEIKEQITRLWQGLSTRQRYTIIAVAVIFAISLLGWSYWWGSRIDYVPLFTAMDSKDAGEVAAKLKEAKIPYEIGGNGTAILVSSKDVYRIRLEMANQGLPRGNKGFEVFDQNKFGTTEFQNKVYLLQALQGELTRTIEQMSEVEKARVHIVMAEDSLYKKNEKPASASIMLKLRPGAQLSREQIKGIVNLTAHSIQGLKPENITVVDNYANVLNDQSDSNGFSGAGTLTQLELTKKIQDDYQKRVQSLLEQVLGPGKAAARVNVELNFDQRTLDRQTFEPVVDDKGIIRSSQDSNESYKGSAPSAGGIPGSASNIPGYATGGNAAANSNYEKKESTRNYEINETKEKIVQAPGSIKRLTVAVLVDTGVDRTQQDSLSKTVASAIGLNPARGDNLSVESISFNTEVVDKQKKDEQAYERQQQQSLWLKIAVGVLGIILVAYLIRRYLRRNEEQDLEIVTMSRTEAGTANTENAGIASQKEMTPQEKERLKQHEAISKLAKTKPEEMAQIIKAWLSEE
ncbi:MAG: flagellar M-ring protein FliF [Firmicutes bacterium]|nr:flagellar M-ring protein FliF [Bacillota bacterium]